MERPTNTSNLSRANTMNLIVALLISAAVVCNVAAQVLLKTGMSRIGYFTFSCSNVFPIAMQVIASPWLICGVFIYMTSFAIWLLVLSRTDVSLAYPLTSLGFILNAIIAYFFLGEHVTLMRLSGTLVIALGIILLARS